MRIVENSPDRLVLRDRTAWMAFVLLAAAAVLGASFFLSAGQPGLLFVAGFFALTGLVFLKSSDVVFDKAQRTCLVRRRDTFKVTGKSVPFDAITNVRADASAAGKWGTLTYRLTLVTAGEDVPLSGVFESGEERYQQMREAVVDLVFDRRPKPAAPDLVESMMKSGRIIDATAVLRQREGLSLTEAKARVDAMRGASGA